MTNVNHIVKLYEDSGTPPEEIAAAMGLDHDIVLAVLKTHSPIYRQLEPGAVEQDVPDDVFRDVKEEMAGIIRSTEVSPFVKVQAAKFLWNERKGRHDKEVGRVALNVNIVNLNERLRIMEMRRASATQLPSAPVEPVEATA